MGRRGVPSRVIVGAASGAGSLSREGGRVALLAPRGEMLGAATKAIFPHRRGAATPLIALRRRNPKGAASEPMLRLGERAGAGSSRRRVMVERRRAPRTGSGGRMLRCSSATMSCIACLLAPCLHLASPLRATHPISRTGS